MKKAGMIGTLAAAAILAGCGKNSRSLHIYTWSDYIAPEVITEFEKAYDCKVVVDTFDSNETMYAKLKAGGAGYDIITPSSYLVSLMAKENLSKRRAIAEPAKAGVVAAASGEHSIFAVPSAYTR